jgi:peptidoglycan/LPS O-acetylase OafA/YrhL
MLVAVVAVRIDTSPEPSGGGLTRMRRLTVVLGLVGLVAAVGLHHALLDGTAWGIAFAALLFLVVTPGGRIAVLARRGLETRAAEGAGKISYSIYLWHVPVLIALVKTWPQIRFHGPLGLLACLVAVLVPTLLLSTLSYVLVERPALARKRPMAPPPPTSVPEGSGTGSAAVGGRHRAARSL